jgi:hypothetical protein
MVLGGAIPGIALAAGLLSLSPDSLLRQQYWPWLPLLTLVIGVGLSALFWFVFVPWRGRDPRR